MHLSKRLQAIANMIPPNVTVVDIGCDHAFLDIYLTKLGKNSCIATDVRKSVLEIAKQNIEDYGLEQEITVIQSDGLTAIKPPIGSVAVIAGMGTSTILNILKNPKIDFFSELIIQTNNDWELLRKEIAKKGFYIIEEKVLLDKNKYYILMRWTKGEAHYNARECFLGPLLMTNKEVGSYYQYLLCQYTHLYSKIPFSCFSKKYRIKQRIRWLKKRKTLD